MSDVDIYVLILRENMLISGEIYTTGKKFYTAGSSEGSDNSHLCLNLSPPTWVKLDLFNIKVIFNGY